MAVLLAAVASIGHQALAQDQPIWTDTPQRVDRDRQDYERLPGKAPPAPPVDDYPLHLDAPYRVLDSVTFLHGGVRYRLASALAIQPTRTCTDDAGARWACGLRSRAALSALISGRPLRCKPAGEAEGFTLVACMQGLREVAATLIAGGNALSDGEAGPYADAQETARRERAGVWANLAQP